MALPTLITHDSLKKPSSDFSDCCKTFECLHDPLKTELGMAFGGNSADHLVQLL